MIIVCNTSPIMNFAVVGQLDLLKRVYQKVFIPEAVFQELSAIRSSQLGDVVIQTVLWIEQRSVANKSLVDSLRLELDLGESEAIILAMEMKADFLILDERRGRNVASRFGLKYIGLLGILVEAKRKGLIDAVKPVLDDLMIKAGFWMGSPIYTRILQEVGETGK